MKDYEVTIILKAGPPGGEAGLEEKNLDAWVKSYEALLAKNSAKAKGKLTPEKKLLAYEIVKGMREGYYVYAEVEMDPEKVMSFEGALKNDETVIRYLVIKKA